MHRGWLALELSRVDASVGTFVGVTPGLAMGTIGVGGSPEQRAERLPTTATGEVVGASGLTEPLSGSDASRGLRTTATRTGDTWVLDGAQHWTDSGTCADVVVVWARDTADEHVEGFLVTAGAPGLTTSTIEGNTALRAVQDADIALRGWRCPRSGACPAPAPPAGPPRCCTRPAGRSPGRRSASRWAPARRRWRTPARVTTRMREVVARSREVCGGGILLETGVARSGADAFYSYEGTRGMNTPIVGRATTGHAALVRARTPRRPAARRRSPCPTP